MAGGYSIVVQVQRDTLRKILTVHQKFTVVGYNPISYYNYEILTFAIVVGSTLYSEIVTDDNVTPSPTRSYLPTGKIRFLEPMYFFTLKHNIGDLEPIVKLYNTESKKYLKDTDYNIEYVDKDTINIAALDLSMFRKVKAEIIGKKSFPSEPTVPLILDGGSSLVDVGVMTLDAGSSLVDVGIMTLDGGSSLVDN